MKTDWTGQRFCTVAELIGALEEMDSDALVFVEYDGHSQNATGFVERFCSHLLVEEDPAEPGTPRLEGNKRYRTVRIRVGSAVAGG